MCPSRTKTNKYIDHVHDAGRLQLSQLCFKPKSDQFPREELHGKKINAETKRVSIVKASNPKWVSYNFGQVFEGILRVFPNQFMHIPVGSSSDDIMQVSGSTSVGPLLGAQAGVRYCPLEMPNCPYSISSKHKVPLEDVSNAQASSHV